MEKKIDSHSWLQAHIGYLGYSFELVRKNVSLLFLAIFSCDSWTKVIQFYYYIGTILYGTARAQDKKSLILQKYDDK